MIHTIKKTYQKIKIILSMIEIRDEDVTINVSRNTSVNIDGILASKAILSFMNSSDQNSVKSNLLTAISNARYSGDYYKGEWLEECLVGYKANDDFFKTDYKPFHLWFELRSKKKSKVVSDNPMENIAKHMEIAKSHSTCSRHSVGCVLTDNDYNVLDIGWNGVDMNDPDHRPCNETFLNGSKIHPDTGEIHSDWSKKHEIHAEIRAMDAVIATEKNKQVYRMFVSHSCCHACSTRINELCQTGILPNLIEITHLEEWHNDDQDKKSYKQLRQKVNSGNSCKASTTCNH